MTSVAALLALATAAGCLLAAARQDREVVHNGIIGTRGPRFSRRSILEVAVMLVRVGTSKDVTAGQMRVFDVAGTKVAVASLDGHLYAFDDACTHARCSLATGELDGTTLTCSCHDSQFDVTSGAVLRGPARRPVRSRAVEVQGDELLVES